jgi:hypothetical protein
MAALMVLTVLRTREKTSARKGPLSVPEIRHLLVFVLHGGAGTTSNIFSMDLIGSNTINSSSKSSTIENKTLYSSLLSCN